MGMLSLDQSVYDLCREHPELVDVLKSLGFESIDNPVMMRTAARVMTIPKAAAMRGIELNQVIKVLEDSGYTVVKGAMMNE
ncbi:DUF1858 domain-containing protein [Anoxynatronum buryatiense]|uniref:DUF1858 domain-containing protein n=1 Tax=Anoxynatronum buryatiense TaxID=489973 RepID=A0AA45WXX5_9CLOT|nr:DUF1858 domain-containing protein [Anoxynatronum buryatiense]SMP66396.1 protein of unknown function [Anoxynatronum buryatiense]